LLLADEVEAAFSERQRGSLNAAAGPYVIAGGDDILVIHDDPGRPRARRWGSPWKRAAAAVAALLVAGAPSWPTSLGSSDHAQWQPGGLEDQGRFPAHNRLSA